MSSGKISSLGAAKAKETIYIDVDEEITAVIDRVTSSKAKIVALVLPKRATVMQSIVNMKLLKRTADTAGKNVVLVTSEAGLMPLAGVAGVHVAATPTSKPVIPEAPTPGKDEPEQVDEPLDVVDGTASDEEGFDPKAAAAVPVGALAAQEPEAILMADDDVDAADDASAEDDDTGKKTGAAVPNKKLKVPSFNKFRLGMILGVLALILLITGWVFAAKILPKAGVAITTDSSTVNSEISLTLSTDAREVDVETSTLPAVAQAVSKTYTQEVPATGELNSGEKASGNVYFALKDCAYDSVTIPSGVSVTAEGNTYITQGSLTLNSLKLGGKCNPSSFQSIWSGTLKVAAIKAGSKSNIDKGVSVALSPSVAGHTSVNASTNTAFTGGTDVITKVVAQADIDSAKSKISSEDTSGVKKDLSSQLTAKGYQAVESTLIAGEQQVTTSVNVGDKADSVKVTITVPYTLLGVKQDDLKTILMHVLEDKVDTKKQTIASDGLDDVKFSQQNPGSASSANVLAKIKTVIGPKLDADAIRKQVVGLRSGEIEDLLKEIPGVTDVEVAYSPFWVNTAPANTEKITIIIDGETR